MTLVKINWNNTNNELTIPVSEIVMFCTLGENLPYDKIQELQKEIASKVLNDSLNYLKFSLFCTFPTKSFEQIKRKQKLTELLNNFHTLLTGEKKFNNKKMIGGVYDNNLNVYMINPQTNKVTVISP